VLLRMDLDPIRAAGLGGARVALREAGRDPHTLLVDDLHLLPHWAAEVDAVARRGVRLVLAGQHEPPKGAPRVELRPRSFRGFLEAGASAARLPVALPAAGLFHDPRDVRDHFWSIHRTPTDTRSHLLEFARRGGYPGARHAAEPEDHLSSQVVERALAVDAPARAPVEQPALLRRILVELARRTGLEVSQGELARELGAPQPVVGRYFDHLEGVGLVRELRRHPFFPEARVPSKMTLADPGLRQALLRTPADPMLRPMAETLLLASLQGPDLTVRFWRDYEKPGDRRSPLLAVSFVLVRGDRALPIQVSTGPDVAFDDVHALRTCMARVRAPFGLLVTRNSFGAASHDPILRLPLVDLMSGLC
jgi:predicted AAA+ superfamily ATPase